MGAAAAALVASVFIMLKGGMVERPQHERDGFGPIGAGGSPDGSGIPTLGDEDPFRRYPRPREGAAAGPEPTQTETQMLSNGDGWSSPEWSPTVSYSSPGDGGNGQGYYTGVAPGTYDSQQAAAFAADAFTAVGSPAIAQAYLAAAPAPTTAEATGPIIQTSRPGSVARI
jgi:hypothetical protein